MKETICPDASACFTCPARTPTIEAIYCDKSVFKTKTPQGRERTEPLNCPIPESKISSEGSTVYDRLRDQLRGS